MTGKAMMMVAAAVLAAAGAFARTNLVVNGGFEEMRDGHVVGWSARAPMYTFRDGEGRSSTRALYYENSNPKAYVFPPQRVYPVPGAKYVFGCWVRTEDIKSSNGGATIGLEWVDKDGNYAGGDYPAGVTGTSDGWVKLEFRLTPVPPHAAKVAIFPYVRAGSTGKAWFDDVFLRPYGGRPVEALYSTAYRNLAADGDVTFKAAVNLPASEYNLSELRAEFAYRAADGTTRRVPAVTLDELCAAVSVPVASLAMGESEVSFRLFQDRNGERELGRASLVFTRVAALPERPTWIDRHGRAIVDGKPFFPLGMYFGQCTTNFVDIYRKGPFNCLMPYTPPSVAMLDYCHSRGLKVFYSVKDAFHGTRWCPGEIRSEADEYRFIEKTVLARKDHPAILAWYLNDERPLNWIDRLVRHYNLVARLDPGHPCWSVLMQYDLTRDYMPSFDVIGTDPYPLPDQPVRMATDWTRTTVKGLMGVKPAWQVPQVYDRRRDMTSLATRGFKAPTLEEIRSMAWQCLAAGANGLVFYSFFEIYEENAPNPKKFDVAWREVCTMAEDIRARIPIFLSVEKPPTITSQPELIVARAWRHEGRDYLLAVNMTREPQHGMIVLDGRYRRATADLGHGASLAAPGRIEVSLAPLGYTFLRLD